MEDATGRLGNCCSGIISMVFGNSYFRFAINKVAELLPPAGSRNSATNAVVLTFLCLNL